MRWIPKWLRRKQTLIRRDGTSITAHPEDWPAPVAEHPDCERLAEPGDLVRAAEALVADAAERDASAFDPGLQRDWLGEPTSKVVPAVVRYPRIAESGTLLDAREWVTDRLLKETGGLTRNPWDRTEGLPTPPTEADRAARAYIDQVAKQASYWTRGFSMRYLGDMQQRALRQDRTLTTDELLILRGRGLM